MYDQLLFRPMIAWVDRFRVEQEPGAEPPPSWALTMMRRSRLIKGLTVIFYALVRWTSWALPLRAAPRVRTGARRSAPALGSADAVWIDAAVDRSARSPCASSVRRCGPGPISPSCAKWACWGY